MSRGTCGLCRAPVLWALTANRKRIPLDPEPDPDGNQAAYRDGTGGWRTRQLGEGQEPAGYERRMMPHFATCTKRQEGRAQLAVVTAPNVIDLAAARRQRRRPPNSPAPRRGA